MSEVDKIVSEVKEEVQAVVEESKKIVEQAKEFFAFEKAHVQVFLDYLAKRPYAEVMELIELLKQGKYIVQTPTTPTEPNGNVAPTDSTPAQ